MEQRSGKGWVCPDVSLLAPHHTGLLSVSLCCVDGGQFLERKDCKQRKEGKLDLIK
jgi:hypothetical protein